MASSHQNHLSCRSNNAPPPAAITDPMAAQSSPVDDNYRPNDYGARQQQQQESERLELRRGPWTVDEDIALVNYITDHGEGRWNALAQAAGLYRTGKSCRLRWLNYLRPDVKRGNFTADEQLLILDLHSRYGNRWSKIAQHLPGRTDNEIKNYWRTRVQKHAKQLNCDANSKRFKDAMRYLWMPHLVDVDGGHHHHRHNGRLLLHADGGYYAAASSDDVVHPALSSSGGGGGGGVVGMAAQQQVAASSSSVDDSLATSDQSTYVDASFPKRWGDTSWDDGDEGQGLLYASVRAGEMLVDDNGGGGDDWAVQKQEMNQGGGLWPAAEQKAAAAAQVAMNAACGGSGGQFEDPELSGWVQSFSDGIVSATDNFWTLEDIWKMQ